jgi:hypothetical protein
MAVGVYMIRNTTTDAPLETAEKRPLLGLQ